MRGKTMNVQKIAEIMKANRLSPVMVGALFSGEDGKGVTAGPKQLAALANDSRAFMDAETNLLTERGVLLVRALKGEVLSDEEEASLVPTPSRRYVIDWDENLPRIFPFSEAYGDLVPISLAEAKVQIIEFAAKKRNEYRELAKATRALRVKDILGSDSDNDAETDGLDIDS